MFGVFAGGSERSTGLLVARNTYVAPVLSHIIPILQ